MKNRNLFYVQASALLLTILSVPFLVSGCSGKKDIVIPDCLPKVVVQKPSIPPKRNLPSLPITSLTAASPNNEVVGKYAATVRILQAEVFWYRGVLENLEKAASIGPTVSSAIPVVPQQAPPVKPKPRTTFGGLLPSTKKTP